MTTLFVLIISLGNLALGYTLGRATPDCQGFGWTPTELLARLRGAPTLALHDSPADPTGESAAETVTSAPTVHAHAA